MGGKFARYLFFPIACHYTPFFFLLLHAQSAFQLLNFTVFYLISIHWLV